MNEMKNRNVLKKNTAASAEASTSYFKYNFKYKLLVPRNHLNLTGGTASVRRRRRRLKSEDVS
jgi:hypothetical protein